MNCTLSNHVVAEMIDYINERVDNFRKQKNGVRGRLDWAEFEKLTRLVTLHEGREWGTLKFGQVEGIDLTDLDHAVERMHKHDELFEGSNDTWVGPIDVLEKFRADIEASGVPANLTQS